MQYTKLKAINEYVSESINPMKSPDQIFEMYSVPIYDTGHPEYLRGDEIGSNKVVVRKNDILLCKINPRINRVWVVADESEYQNIASSEWIVIRSTSYNPEFLAWYFRCPKFKKLMTSEVTGIGGSLTRAQPKAVAEYPVPVLSMDGQEKIVGILNRVNAIIFARKQELQKLDSLIKARFVELFGDPITNNKHWDMDTLLGVLEAGRTVTYGIVQTGDDVDEGIPVFRPIDIAGGHVPKREELKKTLPEISDKYKRTLLKGNELLITIRGSVGETFQVDEEFEGCNVGRNIVPLVTDKKRVNQRFLKELFAQKPIKDWLKAITKGIALQGLNMSEFKEMPVIIPEMRLQEEYVKFAKQIDKSKVVKIA